MNRPIWLFLKFLVVFFNGNLTKPCRHARTSPAGQPAKPDKYYKKNQMLRKGPPVPTTVPSGMSTVIGH